MGLAGNYVQSFAEANFGMMTDVSMNGDYDFSYDVVKYEKGRIVVRSHKTGKESEHVVLRDRHGYQYFNVMHSGSFQQIMGGKPEKIKVVPFKGERT